VDDPVRRERWQELVTHTMLPPLRQLAAMIPITVRTISQLLAIKMYCYRW
jgi:hypothetical protein